jgi:hypothetical protein
LEEALKPHDVLMGLLDLLCRPSLDDPIFGRLRYRRGIWEGRVYFEPVDAEVRVDIRAGTAGPTDAQRERFQVLGRRYPEVVALIERPMFELYEEARKWMLEVATPGVAQPLEGPAAIWRVATLFGIAFDEETAAGIADLVLAYDIRWQNEHYFRVGLRDWTFLTIEADG